MQLDMFGITPTYLLLKPGYIKIFHNQKSKIEVEEENFLLNKNSIFNK